MNSCTHELTFTTPIDNRIIILWFDNQIPYREKGIAEICINEISFVSICARRFALGWLAQHEECIIHTNDTIICTRCANRLKHTHTQYVHKRIDKCIETTHHGMLAITSPSSIPSLFATSSSLALPFFTKTPRYCPVGSNPIRAFG